MAGPGITRAEFPIPPGGGGGIQEIARPVAAPDYARMYSEAMRDALEPAKFYWQTYAESAKQALEEQQLGETRRSNVAKEADEQAKNDIYRAAHEETARHNIAQEGIDKDRATAEQKRLDIEEQMRLTQARAEASRSALEKIQGDRAQIEIDNYKKQNADEDVVNEFRKKVGEGNYLAGDFYGSKDSPELSSLIAATSDKLQTAYGHKLLEEYEAGQNALGRELTARKTMLNWSTDAKDAFQDKFNEIARNHPYLSAPERFFAAFKEGELTDTRVNTRAGWKTGVARQAYQTAIQGGASDADATAAGSLAESKALEKTKGITLTGDNIATIAEGLVPPVEGEKQADHQAKVAKLTGQLIIEYNRDPEGFMNQLGAGGGGGAGKPGETVEEYAKRLLGPTTTPTTQGSAREELRKAGALPGAGRETAPSAPAAATSAGPGATPKPSATPAAQPLPDWYQAKTPGGPPGRLTPSPGSGAFATGSAREQHEDYSKSLGGQAMDYLQKFAQRPFGIPFQVSPRFEPDSWFNPWPRDEKGNLIKADDGGRPVPGSTAGATVGGGGGG